jgi:hypothetical protein
MFVVSFFSAASGLFVLLFPLLSFGVNGGNFAIEGGGGCT